MNKVDPSLRPLYGARVIESLYNAALFQITHVFMRDPFIVKQSDDMFVQRLALACVQMWGRVPSAQF